MIVRLCAVDGGEDDWRARELRPGALFVVGDPKQSIYRFRRADITMYDDVKERIFGEGRWRSCRTFARRRPIIDWVNGVFELMIEAETGVQPGYIALEHQPEFAHGAVELVRGTVPAGSKISDVRAAEGVGDRGADPARDGRRDVGRYGARTAKRGPRGGAT